MPIPDFDASFQLILPPIKLLAHGNSSQFGHSCHLNLAAIEAGDDFVLKLYLRDIARSPLSDTQVSAAEPALFDHAAREHLVLTHLHRVVRMAFDYRGLGLPLGDLVNEGNIGLMRAAELFDPARKVSFAHYAKVWIRMQMKRALSYQALPVSLPADFTWRRGQVLGAEERLTRSLNRGPYESELAAECGLELPALRRIRSTPAPIFVGFESPGSDRQTGYSLTETIPDEITATPDHEAIRKSDLEFIEKLLATLSPCQQRVIRLRFGLEDGCEHTLEEVAKLLGYVRQGIHRIEAGALSKLRQHARFLEVRSQRLSLGWAHRVPDTAGQSPVRNSAPFPATLGPNPRARPADLQAGPLALAV